MIETSVMKELSIGKSAGVDMMSPKLVNLAANYLAGPLSQSINNGIKKGVISRTCKGCLSHSRRKENT